MKKKLKGRFVIGFDGTDHVIIRDGEVYHQVYRGNMSDEQLYQKISDTLTILATGGDRR